MKYSFKEFIFDHFPQPYWSDEYCHVIPQYNFLYDDEGSKQVNFIGKFENLESDFNKVCEALNIPAIKLDHRNQSGSILSIFRMFKYDIDLCDNFKRILGVFSYRQKRNTFDHYTQYYDQETRDYVAKLYEKDIDTFHYRFEK